MSIVASLIFMAIAIGISAAILPGVEVGVWSALGAAMVLGLVNVFIKPILLFLTLPINVLTLGLFTWIINALLILLVAVIVPGFRVRGFGWALAFSIVLTIIMAILKAIF